MKWKVISRTFERLDKLLASQIPELSRSKIEKLIKSGFCLVNGIKISKAGFLIKPNDTIELEFDVKPPEFIESPELEVLYEDDHIIVIDKPAGIMVHKGAGQRSPTVVDFLVNKFGESACFIGSSERPGIVHRLDKDVSGVMVCAKTVGAYRSLVRQFSNRAVVKIYRSWNYLLKASPFWRQDSVTLKTYIYRSPSNRTRFICDLKSSTRGKLGEAEFRVTEILPPFVQLEINLKTGRTHQIRVQSQFLKAPIVGDNWYGISYEKLKTILSHRGICFETKGILLHAKKLEFFHPVTGQKVKFDSKLPERFSKFRSLLESVQV